MKETFKEEITYADIEKFLAVHGQKGAKTLSELSKRNDFAQAITDPIGQSLMKDLMTQMEMLLEKIIIEKASSEEKAEYRVCRKLFNEWVRKIKEYRNLKNKIKQGDKKDDRERN